MVLDQPELMAVLGSRPSPSFSGYEHSVKAISSFLVYGQIGLGSTLTSKKTWSDTKQGTLFNVVGLLLYLRYKIKGLLPPQLPTFYVSETALHDIMGKFDNYHRFERTKHLVKVTLIPYITQY